MRIVRSQRVETLCAAMTERVASPLREPMATEVVVVQTRGLARYLSRELSQALGVWPGGGFPYPRAFVEDVFARILGPEVRAPLATYARSTMTWALTELIPQHLREPGMGELRNYLRGDRDGDRVHALAERVAALFDEYVLYRPDMIARWSSGADAGWQPLLWRALEGKLGPHHSVALAGRLRERLAEARADSSAPAFDLPERVSVFGVATLPPFYLQLFAALAEHTDLVLYQLSPTREYWGDVRPGPAGDAGGNAINPLLASLGRVGRDFHDMLAELDQAAVEERWHDDAPTELLATVQRDFLELRTLAEGARPAAPRDESIVVASCHAAVREVEALRDHLLDRFEQDPTLTPDDVLVMTPDIDRYASLIEAVFGGAQPPAVPYSVADRSARASSPFLEAFDRVLALGDSRCTASAVLDLVALGPLRRKFEFTADEVDTLTEWVVESGIRWGIDAEHRREHGQPAEPTHTWRFGLDRLLLGMAAPAEERALFHDVVPYDEIEGQRAELLGRFVALCEELFQWVRGLSRTRPVAQWCDDLQRMSGRLLAPNDEDQSAAASLSAAFATLRQATDAVGFEASVPLSVFRRALREQLDGGGRGFLAGGVTFCAMLPMRTVPFRVVCVLGLDDDQFPRNQRRPSYDRIAQEPRRGDRSLREDDRYLFLELLLSAREQLYLSYCGQSVRDNSARPPSVVVSELLDYLSARFEWPDARGAFGLVRRHAMQPFSSRYFHAESPLFSYSEGHRRGAEALHTAGDREAAPNFLTERQPPVAPSRDIELEHLIRFFRAPVEHFVRRRLGVYLEHWERERNDREPFELAGGLPRWSVATPAMAAVLRGESRAHTLAIARGTGKLPPGALGQVQHGHIMEEVQVLVEAARPVCVGEPRHASVRADLGEVTVSGRLHDLYDGGMLLHQYSKVAGKHLVNFWLRHLLLSAATPRGVEPRSTLIGRGAARSRRDPGASSELWALEPVGDASEQLRALVQLYWAGQAEPLAFFPTTSLAFATSLHRYGDGERAHRAARDSWAGHRIADIPSEADDAYLRLVYGDRDPTTVDFRLLEDSDPERGFVQLAEAFFGPLLRARLGEGAT